MAVVSFTAHLRQFFPALRETRVEAATVAEALAQLETLYPGLRDYVVDERGVLRKHVNIFVGNSPLADKHNLAIPISDKTHLHIMQALSGG